VLHLICSKDFDVLEKPDKHFYNSSRTFSFCWKKQMLKFMFVEFLGIWELKFDSILWPHCELQMSSDQVWTCRFRIRYISSCISFNGAFVLPSFVFPCIKLLSGYPADFSYGVFNLAVQNLIKEDNHKN
jgi:hypothetical protein